MDGPRSIERLLVANRGEIAVRIARTAHRMGIGTVGVYSDPDADSLHVDAVDLAVALGGASPAQSYLRGDALVAAAVDSGCDAVHPGYGFLAERADFAEAVLAAGLVWVGPPPAQIALLGDKIAAKRAAAEAGVPTTGVIEVTGGTVPAEVAMPALVKAAAGGGGRGMRVVRERDDLAAAVEAASREAEAAFGDGTVFIEPYVERGRHVEVQLLGDAHGNVIHLGDRECSIQRRNQKILEESPSPGIDDSVRAALLEGAVRLGRHVGYENAGTVEFLVGDDGTITFLEVNTRLQVEHPVTEAVTGLDLVELQLRVSAGEPLALRQEDVTFDGHSIEVRVVAEDPVSGWLPAGGALRSFEIDGDVRVDTGVAAGSTVTGDYDSLLAKVIAHGPDRRSVARRLARAVRTARVTGVRTDIDALAALLVEDDFLRAETTTAYLDEHPQIAAASGPAGDDRLALLLGATFAAERQRRTDSPVAFAPSGWRNLRTAGQRRRWHADGADDVDHVEYVVDGRGDRAQVRIGAWPEPADDGALPADDRRSVDVRLLRSTADHHVVEIDGVRHRVGTTVHVDHDGRLVVDTWSPAGTRSWTLLPRFEDHDELLVGAGPVSPLPGTVIAVDVRVGDSVTEGTVLVVVEAMKMEHTITSPTDAVVTAVHFSVGDRVDAGNLLVSLDAAGEDRADG